MLFRSLKPPNVILAEGDPERVKIIGCGDEVSIGCDKDERSKVGRSEGIVSNQSCSKLNSVIATQCMVQGQLDGPINNRAIGR